MAGGKPTGARLLAAPPSSARDVPSQGSPAGRRVRGWTYLSAISGVRYSTQLSSEASLG